MVEGPEECDDGNLDNGDCCSSFCTYEPAESPCQADADYCTIDRCDGAGTCAFVAPVECTALDQCHVPGTCDPGTGVCSNPNKPNGFACDDGDFCTAPDVCTDGVCLGNTVGADSDQDGYCDSWENLVGCNPNDFAETPPQGASSPGSAGPVPGQVLLVFAVPSSRRVSVASEPACATAGVCGATGLCVAGKVGDPCDAAADCNGSPGVCRVIVNYADVPGLGLSAALLNRKPLAGFSPATAGCARKVDVTLDPSKEFNRVRLKAMGTVHGRSRFDRDRITFAP
jgi:cysteine-rich repeat protein